MKINNPPFFWPTKTVIVDDDDNFLEELQDLLGVNNYVYFNSPEKALDFINRPSIQLDWYLSTTGRKHYFKKECTIQFPEIHKIKERAERHNIISTVIADYNMPSMFGTDLCKQISSSKNIKTTLLTSEMSCREAIDHLNNKNIDKYFEKKNITKDKIEQLITKQKIEYFHDISKVITDIAKTSDSSSIWLTEDYNRLFASIISEYNIKEYYLLTDSGWFCLVDKAGRFLYFFIFSHDEIIEMSKEVEFFEENKKMFEDLSSCKKALCYYDSKDSSWPPYHRWLKYLKPVRSTIIKKEVFYYAVVEYEANR